MKIGHAHLTVRDLERALACYIDLLGLRLIEQVGDQYAFLSSGAMHHEIALQYVGGDAPAPPQHGTGLYHVAFEVPDQASLARMYQTLTTAGVMVHPVDHLISWALYFSDPDDNGLELYWDTRQEPGGATLWQGRNVPLPIEKLQSV